MVSSEQVSLIKQRISGLLGKLQVLPFSKSKFPSKVYYDQNDNLLGKKLDACEIDQLRTQNIKRQQETKV